MIDGIYRVPDSRFYNYIFVCIHVCSWMCGVAERIRMAQIIPFFEHIEIKIHSLIIYGN